MTWLWKEIKDDWLAGGALVEPPEVVIEAFERVETYFGRSWIEASRVYEGAEGPARGSAPTLNIVTLGRELAVLDHARNNEKLLKKLRDREGSANAELSGIWLTCKDQEVEVEYERQVTVSGRTRKADFRVRRDKELWTYAEVTQPQRSEAQKTMHLVMDQLTQTIKGAKGSYSVEVFFLRIPEASEVEHVRTEFEKGGALSGAHEVTLSDDLGIIYFNELQPGNVVIDDHGFPSVPRLGRMERAVENGVPVRQVTVRIPYSDSRGNYLLATEAGQLPGDSPGLIMVHVSGAPGALKGWVPVLEGEFQLELYHKVSAMYLFMGGIYPTDRGEEQRIESKLILNEQAHHQLPAWIQTQLSSD